MSDRSFITLKEVASLTVDAGARYFAATGEEIDKGLTSDIYFVRTRELLAEMELGDTVVTAEIFSSRSGVVAGIDESLYLLRNKNLEIKALPEGATMDEKEVVMRIRGRYSDFGIYETALLGILSSSSAWASAARICKQAAGEKRVICYGARHLHPAVAPVMERAAIIGGADACSCVLGAVLLGQKPVGTVPHAAFLIAGDTVELAKAYDLYVDSDTPRIILVDTFKDEAEEALRLAVALRGKLDGIRLDTPGERGGVTAGLVKETRARLDQAGFNQVRIVVSGGLTPERITQLGEAGADAFGVGSYISREPAIDMTMDLKEVEGKPLAKRGRIPGLTENPRLQKIG